MLPVIIINGPLGSGKTTLIHALLKKHINAQKTLWLKTEFGDESVDEYVLADTGVQTAALTGGCICHVLLSQLDGVLTQIEAAQNIDQLIIETSGMSHPAPVIQTIERHPLFRVAHVALIVDVAHAREDSYPKPMILPGEVASPYDVIVLNKYPESLTSHEEGNLGKALDPWFAGVYDGIKKVRVPDLSASEAVYDQHIDAWAQQIVADIANALQQSPKDISDDPLPEYEHEDAEDHEGEIDVLTFHLPADRVTPRSKIDAYVAKLPSQVVRVKGVIHTGPDTWEFFNWVRGTGHWSALDSIPAGQVLLVMGDDIEQNNAIQSIDI